MSAEQVQGMKQGQGLRQRQWQGQWSGSGSDNGRTGQPRERAGQGRVAQDRSREATMAGKDKARLAFLVIFGKFREW